MSVIGTIRDVVVGRAMKLASDPRVTRLVADPRLMNVAMKAIGVGGTVKGKLDQATKLAAGAFGFVTQEEVAGLRSTIQSLEDQIAVLESRAAAASKGAGALAAPPVDGDGAKKAARKAQS